MLDLFSDVPLGDTPMVTDDLVSTFPFFDISEVTKQPYEYDPDPASSLRSHRGGIRRAVFGTDNALTKAVLVRPEPGMDIFVEWHHVRPGASGRRDRRAAALPFHTERSSQRRRKRCAPTATAWRPGTSIGPTTRPSPANRQLTLYRPTAQRYLGPRQLVELGFLHMSERYRRLLEETAERAGSSGSAR